MTSPHAASITRIIGERGQGCRADRANSGGNYGEATVGRAGRAIAAGIQVPAEPGGAADDLGGRRVDLPAVADGPRPRGARLVPRAAVRGYNRR